MGTTSRAGGRKLTFLSIKLRFLSIKLTFRGVEHRHPSLQGTRCVYATYLTGREGRVSIHAQATIRESQPSQEEEVAVAEGAKGVLLSGRCDQVGRTQYTAVAS
jgi:hypothetical protein